jgi:hypothetical protein
MTPFYFCKLIFETEEAGRLFLTNYPKFQKHLEPYFINLSKIKFSIFCHQKRSKKADKKEGLPSRQSHI